MFAWLRKKRAEARRASPSWRQAKPLRGLSPAQLDALERLVIERRLEAGDVLISEGDRATSIFIVESGSFDVSKRETARDKEHVIDTVVAGQTLGEAALFEQITRAATVRAREPAVVFEVPMAELRRRGDDDPALASLHQALVLGLVEGLATRLRAQAHDKLATAQAQDVMGHFVVNVLILVCAYVYLLAGLQRLGDASPTNTSYVSIPLQLVFGAGSWYFIRRSGYPLSTFGLSFKDLIGSVLEAILFTVPALAVVTAIKWLLMAAGLVAGPLVAFPDWQARLISEEVLPKLAVYAVACLVQELVVRSALQSSLEQFLTGAHAKRNAIVVSALLFSVTHLHMSFLFATLAFLPGLYWGWLFARRRNLAGVTLSHIAVGACGFFILGVQL
ncbi:MAG: cyclic nucleotide-binding domain-containing protein [Myxococcota bacterium]